MSLSSESETQINKQELVVKANWSNEDIELQFGAAPLRTLGKLRTRGYYQIEIEKVGITKTQLKSLVKKQVLEKLDFKCETGQYLNFYRLKE